MPDPFPPPGYVKAPSTVEGIDVYLPTPPEAGEHQEVTGFKCPQCGATTAYSIVDGGLVCSHCGYYEAPEREPVGKGAQEFEFTVDTMERSAQGWGETRKELECQQCGARTSIPADSLSHTCPFCGSNQVLQRQAPQDVLRPRFLIPFQVNADACQGIAREWLASSWMTPAALKDLANLASFTPVYLPYWTFDALTSASWRAEVGHTVSERYYDASDKTWKTRTKTVWRWESGRVTLNFDDLLIAGTGRLSARLLDQIGEFAIGELVPFESAYLAGMHAQAYDLPLETAWERARQKMRQETRLACIKQASTSQVRNFSMSLDFGEEEWRYVLLPVHVAAYTFAGETYQVMLNGQSGAIAGQRPVDWTKIWLAIAALLAPGTIVGAIGLVTLLLGGIGVAIGGVGFLLLVIGSVIAFLIHRKAQEMDDL